MLITWYQLKHELIDQFNSDHIDIWCVKEPDTCVTQGKLDTKNGRELRVLRFKASASQSSKGDIEYLLSTHLNDTLLESSHLGPNMLISLPTTGNVFCRNDATVMRMQSCPTPKTIIREHRNSMPQLTFSYQVNMLDF